MKKCDEDATRLSGLPFRSVCERKESPSNAETRLECCSDKLRSLISAA